jgi:hypothetical protein
MTFLLFKVGSSVAHDDYDFIALLFILLLVLAVFHSTKFGLLILLFLGFIGHQIIQFGAPPQLIYFWDLIVILLFVKAVITTSLSLGTLQTKGLIPILGVIAVLITSHILSGTGILHALLFSRYLTIGYLLFISVLNLELKDREIRTVINIIIFLFLIQIPASVIKLILLGQGEQSVGTFGFSPGELGTLLPLFAISFLFALTIYEPARKHLYTLLIVGFIGFSLIAEKRAFVFFLPLIFLSIFLLFEGNSQRKIKFILLFILLFLVTGYSFPRLNATWNPQHRIGGDFDLNHIYNFVNEYMNLHDPMGRSQGRLATTKMTITNLRSSNKFLLVGDGPGKLINSGIIDADMNVSKFAYNIEDGITGFAWISLQIGILGFAFYALFLLTLLYSIWRIYKSTSDRVLKIFGLGLLGAGLVFLLDIVAYSKVFVSGRHLSMAFFILSGIYLKYGKQREKN